MTHHVHVRLRQGLSVNDQGELVEQLGCGCGETWTKTHSMDGGQPEQ